MGLRVGCVRAQDVLDLFQISHMHFFVCNYFFLCLDYLSMYALRMTWAGDE